MKKLRITVGGRAYNVEVEVIEEGLQVTPAAPANSVSRPPKPTVSSAPGTGRAEVTSPLSGKLVSIEVKLGQQVTDGQQVATIEAMKMNTYVYASRSGTVETIAAQAGDAIEEGSLIVRIA